MTRKRRNKRAFTLIELIVVIAVLGILVLLAAYKFLGHTQEARLAHVQNDVRAYESVIEIAMIEDESYIESKNWGTVEIEEMEEYRDEGALFDREGAVENDYEFDDRHFEVEEELVNSKLKGLFIVNAGGKVYYYEEGLNLKNKENDGNGNEKENDGNEYDEDGYDKDGFDKDGYDENGYDENGYDENGYDENGYDEDGYDENGYNEDGYNEDGYNEDGYDEDGYDEDGYDEDGYDEDGYDEDGYNEDGLDKDGLDKDGFLQIKGIPVGSIVVDNSWDFSHRSGNNFSTPIVKRESIEWMIVDTNSHFKQEGYDNTEMENHVTLIANETIAKYNFIEEGNKTSWTNSAIRQKFLNYSFLNSMSVDFKNNIVLTKTKTAASTAHLNDFPAQTTSNERAFLLSHTELGGNYANDGVKIPFFDSNDKRSVTGVSTMYWKRSPSQGASKNSLYIGGSGSDGSIFAPSGHVGVRPAVNLKSNVIVSDTGVTKTNAIGVDVKIYEIIGVAD